MSTYNINLNTETSVLSVGFGEAAQNNQIVKDAQARFDEMKNTGMLPGGPLIKVNGSASVPVAFVILHNLGHLYGAVAMWDPKLSKYVVAVTHNPSYKLGDLID